MRLKINLKSVFDASDKNRIQQGNQKWRVLEGLLYRQLLIQWLLHSHYWSRYYWPDFIFVKRMQRREVFVYLLGSNEKRWSGDKVKQSWHGHSEDVLSGGEKMECLCHCVFFSSGTEAMKIWLTFKGNCNGILKILKCKTVLLWRCYSCSSSSSLPITNPFYLSRHWAGTKWGYH